LNEVIPKRESRDAGKGLTLPRLQARGRPILDNCSYLFPSLANFVDDFVDIGAFSFNAI
jgi:hypothetical protein